MLKISLSLFIVFFILSCENEESSQFTYTGSFPDAVVLEGEQILQGEIGNLIVTTADSMVVLTKQMEPYFKVFDTDLSPLAAFGKAGEGPGELPEQPFLFDIYSGEDIYLGLIYLNSKSELMTIDMSESIRADELDVYSMGQVPAPLSAAQHIFLNTDGESVVGIYDDRFDQQLDQKRGMFYLNPENEEYELVELYNLSITPFDLMAEMNLNGKVPAISRNHKKMVIAGRFSPTVEVVDLSTNTLAEAYYTVPVLPSSEFDLDDFETGEVLTYYNFAGTTDEYIFLLYEGQKNYKLDEPNSKMIQVLDWSGNPAFQFEIPEVYDIHQFTVDSHANRIIAISHSQDALYAFDLPVDL